MFGHKQREVFISRVLYGRLHVRSLDWAEPEEAFDRDGQSKAILQTDSVIQVRALQ